MAKYKLYRADDLSGDVVADDTKFIVGADGVSRNELDHLQSQAGYTQDKGLAEIKILLKQVMTHLKKEQL